MTTAGQMVQPPILLPVTNSSTAGRCTLQGSSNFEAHIGLTQDGSRLLVPCYNAVLGASTILGGIRTVAVIDSEGAAVDTSLVYTTSSSESPRGATGAIVNGALRIYLATSNGVKMLTAGQPLFAPAVALTSTGSVRQISIFNGGLFTASGSSPYGVASILSGASLPVAAPGTLATVATMLLPGTGAAWL